MKTSGFKTALALLILSATIVSSCNNKMYNNESPENNTDSINEYNQGIQADTGTIMNNENQMDSDTMRNMIQDSI